MSTNRIGSDQSFPSERLITLDASSSHDLHECVSTSFERLQEFRMNPVWSVLFEHVGAPICFESLFTQTLPSNSCLGWQELVFSIDLVEQSCRFRGVEVYWGNATQMDSLFGADCIAIQDLWNTAEFWDYILPFCATVLELSASKDFVPFVRLEFLDKSHDYPISQLFLLSDFDYSVSQWNTTISSIATPSTQMPKMLHR